MTSPGDTVHQQCRKTYCNPKSINLYQQKKQSAETPPTLRSRYCFEFSEQCLFCGQKAVKSEKKRKNESEVFQVRTKDFQRNIEDICRQRNDTWSVNVLGRLEYARDLHAADAVYHQSCSVNFRTFKTVPKPFSPKVDKHEKN